MINEASESRVPLYVGAHGEGDARISPPPPGWFVTNSVPEEVKEGWTDGLLRQISRTLACSNRPRWCGIWYRDTHPSCRLFPLHEYCAEYELEYTPHHPSVGVPEEIRVSRFMSEPNVESVPDTR
jgi:hypothetical protein